MKEGYGNDQQPVRHGCYRERPCNGKYAQWFIDEQVEEEESATTIIDSLKLVSGDKMGVFMLDKELAARTYTQAAPLAGKE